jgi:hypothetical protein
VTGGGNLVWVGVLRVTGMGSGQGEKMSHKTRVKFTIKETDNGTPYLYMEALDNIPNFPKEPPAFDLPPGTDMEKATEIANYLNSNLAAYRPEPTKPSHGWQTMD